MLNKLVFENLRQRPVRTCLSVLAIGVEVTMILTLDGISYGTLDETARRARGVGALTSFPLQQRQRFQAHERVQPGND